MNPMSRQSLANNWDQLAQGEWKLDTCSLWELLPVQFEAARKIESGCGQGRPIKLVCRRSCWLVQETSTAWGISGGNCDLLRVGRCGSCRCGNGEHVEALVPDTSLLTRKASVDLGHAHTRLDLALPLEQPTVALLPTVTLGFKLDNTLLHRYTHLLLALAVALDSAQLVLRLLAPSLCDPSLMLLVVNFEVRVLEFLVELSYLLLQLSHDTTVIVNGPLGTGKLSLE